MASNGKLEITFGYSWWATGGDTELKKFAVSIPDIGYQDETTKSLSVGFVGQDLPKTLEVILSLAGAERCHLTVLQITIQPGVTTHIKATMSYFRCFNESNPFAVVIT